MIVVIDYKMGNIGSILNMLKKIDAEGIVSSDPDEIKNADKLILPGVGSFDEGIKNLKDSGLISVIEHKVISEKTPILGICLGMQLFAKRSEEGVLSGLGWIDAEVKKFSFGNDALKVPHMGWNTVEVLKQDDLLRDMPDPSRFYFVHSYYFICNDSNNALLATDYGHNFVSAVKKDNIIGVQFHPEKSHKFGMKLLQNFTALS
jgi:imidazole glycerol-phosphate synthase subunit HisH